MGISIGNSEISTATGIYCGSRKLRPGEIPPFTPGENTLLYYDFEHTSGTSETDVAGNYSGTYLSTPTIGVLSSGKKYFISQGTNYLYTSNTISNINYGDVTINVWISPQQVNSGDNGWFGQDWRSHTGGTIVCYSTTNSGTIKTSYYIGSWNGDWFSTNMDTGAWNNIVIVGSGTTQYVYKNGVLIGTRTMNASSANKRLYIGTVLNGDGTITRKGNANYGSVILENKARTAEEISNYYDQTKSNYGL